MTSTTTSSTMLDTVSDLVWVRGGTRSTTTSSKTYSAVRKNICRVWYTYTGVVCSRIAYEYLVDASRYCDSAHTFVVSKDFLLFYSASIMFKHNKDNIPFLWSKSPFRLGLCAWLLENSVWASVLVSTLVGRNRAIVFFNSAQRLRTFPPTGYWKELLVCFTSTSSTSTPSQ